MRRGGKVNRWHLSVQIGRFSTECSGYLYIDAYWVVGRDECDSLRF